MLQVQAVDALGIMARVAARILILRDHLFAAARIAGQRRAGEGEIRRHHILRDQRVHGRDKPARVAAGVGHPPGLPDRRAVRRRQLGKAVIPVRVGAVRGRSVDHAGIFVFDQADGLPGRRVRQAQEHDVRRIEERQRPCACPRRSAAARGRPGRPDAHRSAGRSCPPCRRYIPLVSWHPSPAQASETPRSSSVSATNFSILSIWRVTSCGAGPPITLRSRTQVRRSSAS